MDYNELVKALMCDGNNIGQDSGGCTNKKCRYRDPDSACNIVSICEDAAAALSTLQAENEKLRETVDKYAIAARAIALNLKPFCDESLPYDEMIADAAGKASDEMERVKRLYESEKEDFIDFACSGVPNLSPYCMNRRPDCVDERCWCRSGKCHGFSRERGQKED